MQKYGVVYPNGFCGQWLVWMMQSHPDFSDTTILKEKKIKQFVEGNSKTGHYTDAALWTPKLNYDEIAGFKNNNWPPLTTPLTFDDFFNLYTIKTDKIIFRMGPNHNPYCATIICDYIPDIKYILLSSANLNHRRILETRINEYANSKWHKDVKISRSINARLRQVQSFYKKAQQNNLDYTILDIGKLVFDADVDEYKKLCDYTNTEYRVDIFNQFQQEYYDEVWKHIIE